MRVCIKCGVPLTEETAYSNYLEKNDYACILCHRKRAKERYVKNRVHIQENKRIWYQQNKERKTLYEREKYAQLKYEVLYHYTWVAMEAGLISGYPSMPKCMNPFGQHKEPFTDIDCLTIDHINNDGAKHRKEIGQSKIYIWLKTHKYPTGYQVLCMNCQFKKERKRK